MEQTTRHALADFPRQLEAHFSLIPEPYWNWSPASWDDVPSEPFPALSQICHIRDIEIDGYHQRIQRIRREKHPVLPPVDGEALAINRRYTEAKPAEVFAAIRAGREQTLAMLDDVAPGEWNRTALFGSYGSVTLRGLVHYLCSHDQQHLAGLQWLLGRLTSAT